MRKIRPRSLLCIFGAEVTHFELGKNGNFTNVKNIMMVLTVCSSVKQN